MRRWLESDLAPFAELCADAAVMRYFPAVLSPTESTALVAAFEQHFAKHGFGLWVLENRSTGEFLGYTGMATVQFASPIQREIEIGWRLARKHWGHGYAFEAARAATQHGFSVLNLKQIVSMTVAENRRSWGLMERLGMVRAPHLDFDHPRLPDGHLLRPHIVYSLKREQWPAEGRRSKAA